MQESVKSPFYWESPDGSKLLSYWLSGTYDIHWKGVAETSNVMSITMCKATIRSLLLWGMDLYFPNESTAEIEKQNSRGGGGASDPGQGRHLLHAETIFCRRRKKRSPPAHLPL